MFTGNYHCATWVFVGQSGAISCFVFFEGLDELDAVRSDLHYPLMGSEMFKAAMRLVLFCQCLTLHRFAQSLDTTLLFFLFFVLDFSDVTVPREKKKT